MYPSIACTHLIDFSLIKITGNYEKVRHFLQGQLSCDVHRITATHSALTAYCNHKGRLESSLLILCYHDQFYGFLPKSMVSHTLQLFNKFGRFSQLTATEDDQHRLWGIYDQDTAAVWAAHWGTVLPQKAHEVVPAQSGFMLAVPGFGSQVRYLVGSQSHESPVPDTISQHPWRWGDIQSGVVYIYPETIGLFTPHKLNYPKLDAVSFTKGCFVGQEIIARTEHLGTQKYALGCHQIQATNPPRPGDHWNGGQVADIHCKAAGSDWHIMAVVYRGALGETKSLPECNLNQ